MTTAYFNLASGDFVQDWSTVTAINANDDWSGIPSIVGYLGDISGGSITNTDARTLTGANLGAIDVIANQINYAISNGGVAEFQNGNPTIAFQGSGTADAPSIVLYLDATGRSDLHLDLDLTRVDTDTATQQFNIQYRLADGATWFAGDFGADMVADFSNGDRIVLDDAQFATYADVIAHASQTDAGVVIALDAGHSITLSGVLMSSLKANDFLFV